MVVVIIIFRLRELVVDLQKPEYEQSPNLQGANKQQGEMKFLNNNWHHATINHLDVCCHLLV